MNSILFSKLSLPENFSNFEKSEKLKFVLNEPDNVKLTAQFIIDAYHIKSEANQCKSVILLLLELCYVL